MLQILRRFRGRRYAESADAVLAETRREALRFLPGGAESTQRTLPSWLQWLLVSEGDDGIELGCASRGPITRGGRDKNEHRHDADERYRIGRTHLHQEASKQSSHSVIARHGDH